MSVVIKSHSAVKLSDSIAAQDIKRLVIIGQRVSTSLST